jgi:hypothetical protein
LQRDVDVNLNSNCAYDDEENIVGNCIKSANVTVHLNKTHHNVTALNITKNHTKNNISTEYDKKVADLKRSGANVTFICPNASNSSNKTSEVQLPKTAVKTEVNGKKSEVVLADKNATNSSIKSNAMI